MLCIRCRGHLWVAAACAGVLLGQAVGRQAAQGQEAGRRVDPQAFGFDLPAGEVRPGGREAVNTRDEAGEPTVGRVHVRVGEHAIVLLPDGQLVARRAGEFSPCERKFEALSKNALAARLAGEFPGFKTHAANHFVYAFNGSEEYVLAAGRILETMLPGVKGYPELSKLGVQGPEFPLVVVVFRTEAEFRRHRRLPPGAVAYYDPVSNRVYMYEESALDRVRPDLAIKQSITTIAHEGAHQILHNIGVQQRLSVWPMWLSEGLAEYFAPTSTGEKLRWKGAGQINDLRMFELSEYFERREEAADGEMLQQTVLAARLNSTGYASAWALTHYLAKNRRSEFLALIREASQLDPLEGRLEAGPIVRENLAQFERHFGDNLAGLERRLIAYLKKQPYANPFEHLPHYVATLEADSERSVATFRSRAEAAAWLREASAKLPADKRSGARAQVRDFPNRMLAEAFVRGWRKSK